MCYIPVWCCILSYSLCSGAEAAPFASCHQGKHHLCLCRRYIHTCQGTCLGHCQDCRMHGTDSAHIQIDSSNPLVLTCMTGRQHWLIGGGHAVQDFQKTAGDSLAQAQSYAEGTAKGGQNTFASSRKAVEQRLKDSRDAANEQVCLLSSPPPNTRGGCLWWQMFL